ncbi:MAG: peptide deformylase [bacterium]
MTLEIIKYEDPILRQKCPEFEIKKISNPQIKKIIKDMIDSMYINEGAGIAAPQIGLLTRICVVSKNHTEKQEDDLVLINPVWKRKGFRTEIADEGCLSVPKKYGAVKRYKKITVSSLDRNGKQIKFVATNFFARVIQHEIDHLNGILFIDKAKNIREIYTE